MEETFIPESTSELYQKMISDTFRGNLNYSEDCIIWNVYSEFILKVCINKIIRRDDSYWIEGYIEIYFVGNDGREEYITHYHPAGEEIYIIIGKTFSNPCKYWLCSTLRSLSTQLLHKTYFKSKRKQADTF